MDHDPASRIARLLADADIVFAVAASADGKSTVGGGDTRNSGFESLLSMLIGDPARVRRTYEFLEGKLLPQSYARGDAHVYLHKGHGN